LPLGLNVNFFNAYEQTIEYRAKAEIEAEHYRQNLERGGTNCRAQGSADAQVKATEAEAASIAHCEPNRSRSRFGRCCCLGWR